MKKTRVSTNSSSLRWLLYSVFVLSLLAISSWLAVPIYVKKTLEVQVEAQTGRQFNVGEVSFNPLTLCLSITNIKLFEADKKALAFSADKLEIKASLASLFRMAPVLREVVLTHPNLSLRRSRPDGIEVTNFSDVIARLAQHPSNGDPVRYSVSNIQLSDGVIHYDDQIAGKKMNIDSLTIGLPFFSNFSSSVDIFVKPSLTAKINGSLVDLKGRSKPFTGSHETSLQIDINQFDLTEIIAFSPKPLPVKVNSAKFSSMLNLNFYMKDGKQRLTVDGTVRVNQLAMTDFSDAPLFQARELSADIHEVDLMSSTTSLNSLVIKEPQVWIGLNHQGIVNWLNLPTQNSPKIHQNAIQQQGKSKPVPSTNPILVELAHFQLNNGTVHWSDAANADPVMTMEINHVTVDAQKISTNSNAAPAKMSLSFGEADRQQVNFDGSIDIGHSAINGQLGISALDIATYQPYINRTLAAKLSGLLTLQTNLAIQNSNALLSGCTLAIDHFKLQATKSEYGGISANKIGLVNLSLDTESRQVKLAELQLGHVQGEVLRAADGEFNFNQLVKKSVISNDARSDSPIDPKINLVSTKKPPEWLAQIDKLSLLESSFAYGDKSVVPSVNIQLDQVSASVEKLSNKLDQAVQLNVRATLNKTGKFSAQGSGSTNGLKLQVKVNDFPLPSLQPYFTDYLNITLSSGTFSTEGQVAWSAPTNLSFNGMAKLANLRSLDKLTSDEFLKWRLLEINGIAIALNAKQNNITLGKIALNDFYARTILSEQGQLNLNDIMVQTKTPIKKALPENTVNPETNALSATPTASTTEVNPVDTIIPPAVALEVPRVINVGQIQLNGGVINYTDNFIRPHYSMRITGLKGNVGALTSTLAQSAPIELNGKVDDEAPLSISGSLNPLFYPMLLDIRMTADGVDLPHLTTYSAKYAGYPIEKGKLSLDVHYQIQNNQLEASNALKIDQLTFGTKTDSADAIQLPVPFLISILTDKNGQINLDLPISGSINNPEFSLSGLIAKVLINLLEKTVASPFSLLSHAFGGEEEFSYIEFDSGSSQLSEANKLKLTNLGKALEEHPDLKLDIMGRADMNADITGLREHLLARKIQKLVNSTHAEIAESTITPAESAKAIDQLYAAGKFEKPRNALGIAKRLPTGEMERLLLANIIISEEDLRALAIRRENSVRNSLADYAHIPLNRMYSIAPKLDASDIKDQGATTRVEFGLKI